MTLTYIMVFFMCHTKYIFYVVLGFTICYHIFTLVLQEYLRVIMLGNLNLPPFSTFIGHPVRHCHLWTLGICETSRHGKY